MAWYIETWMGQQYIDTKFDSFEDARAAIDEIATQAADDKFKPDTPQWDEVYQGINEDLYATEEVN